MNKLYMSKIHILDVLKIVFQIDVAAAGLFFVLKVFLALIPSLQTLMIAKFVDEVTLPETVVLQNKKIWILVFLLVMLVAYKWTAKGLTELARHHMKMRIRETFKPRLLEKISCFKYEAMENGDIRDKVERICTNTEDQICEAYDSMLQFLELILKVAGVLIIMSYQVWWLSFAVLVVSIPCFSIAIKSGKEDYDAQADVTRINRVNEYYNEILKNREYVDERTLFGYQEAYREKFLKQYEEARRYSTKIRMKWFLKMKVGSMAVILVAVFFLAVMIPLTLEGGMSFGMFMALTSAVFGMIQNMSWDLTYCVDRSAWYNEYFRELEELFAVEEELRVSENENMKKLGKGFGEFRTLEFKNVSFRYPGTERDILKNLSFRIEAGKKYAFAGANGAGKTTIIKLINCLYQEYEGEILINGEDIRNFERGIFSNVFQDFARYPISVRENLIIGCKGPVTEMELMRGLKEVELEQTVKKLKDGVNTVLGKIKKNSQDISGGEWQKIALGRCVLSKAPVRILDEPTSAMDPVHESRIYRKFQQMSKGKTVLLVSHRLASVKISDCIFVIANGTVAEAGSHSVLMEKDGLYKAMYEEQAKWYKAEKGGKKAYE